MKLSTQALGSVMLALQHSLMAQEDIVPILLNFEFKMDEDGKLIVLNPPTVDLSNSVEADYNNLMVSEEDVVEQ